MTSCGRWFSLAVAMLSLSFGGCATVLKGPAISGRVLEQDTNRPLAGAVVLAYWSGDIPHFPESSSACFEVLSGTTDAQGNYHLKAWRRLYWESQINGPQVRFLVYYPGYIYHRIQAGPGDNEAMHFMLPDTSSREVRFETLSRLFGSGYCGWYYSGSSMKNFIPFEKGIATELKFLAQSPKELERLQQVRESVAYDSVRKETDAHTDTEDLRQRVKKFLEEHPE
jgi:hypothetical protein